MRSEVLYEKKKAPSSSSDRFAHTGPIGFIRRGSMDSITCGRNSVNLKGVPFSEVVSTQGDGEKQVRYSTEGDVASLAEGKRPRSAAAEKREAVQAS